jgi:hypothetical protein
MESIGHFHEQYKLVKVQASKFALFQILCRNGENQERSNPLSQTTYGGGLAFTIINIANRLPVYQLGIIRAYPAQLLGA